WFASPVATSSAGAPARLKNQNPPTKTITTTTPMSILFIDEMGLVDENAT
ncbi:MAG: hypothetical protein RL681_260, partial [Candidatus Parcubacteria bacterium]